MGGIQCHSRSLASIASRETINSQGRVPDRKASIRYRALRDRDNIARIKVSIKKVGTGTEPAREVVDLDPVLVDLVEPVPGVLGRALLLVSWWRWSRINRCGGLVDGIDGFRGSLEVGGSASL